jgi:hypothetical protein
MATPGGAVQHSDGSLAGYASLEALLAAHLPPDQLREAQRVLYGAHSWARFARAVCLLAVRIPNF